MGKRCQIRSGDQRCALFAGRPQLWCRLRLLRTMLQRTQHFVRGLKIPTCAWLRRAATSRPAVFDFNQVKNRRGAWMGSSENSSAFAAILLFVGSVGWCWPVFSELRSPVLVSPAEASIHRHISHCQRLNRCRGKADSEIGKLDPFRSSTYAPSANPHVTDTGLGRESPARIVAREWSSWSSGSPTRPRTGETRGERAEAEFKAAGPARVARTRRTARGSHSVAHLIQRRRTDKSRPREGPQDRGSRTESIADTGRRARSRISETHGERAEAKSEAAGPAGIPRRHRTARAGHSLAHPIQRRRTDKSR